MADKKNVPVQVDKKNDTDPANQNNNPPDKNFTEVKDAHAAGTGALERNDAEQTNDGTGNNTTKGLEGAEEY